MLYDQILSDMTRYMDTEDFYKKPKNKIKYTVEREAVKNDHRRRMEQPRNELCNCGSKLKFKKCCGKVINDDNVKNIVNENEETKDFRVKSTNEGMRDEGVIFIEQEKDVEIKLPTDLDGAYELMARGHKVSNHMFSKEEYLEMRKEGVFTEDGYLYPVDDLLEEGNDYDYLLNGWTIWKEINNHEN